MQVELIKLKKCIAKNKELIQNFRKDDKEEYDKIHSELFEKVRAYEILNADLLSKNVKDATDSVSKMEKLETDCLKLIAYLRSFLKCEPDPIPQPQKPQIKDKGARPGAVSPRPVSVPYTYQMGQRKKDNNNNN